MVNNTVLVGSSFKEGFQPLALNNTKGLTRAFDVRTGKLLWTFHNIPQKGEFGYDTWKNGSADFNGNTGVWTGITVDPELNLVYLPVEDPTNDFTVASVQAMICSATAWCASISTPAR